jgi:hypothetical protein
LGYALNGMLYFSIKSFSNPIIEFADERHVRLQG